MIVTRLRRLAVLLLVILPTAADAQCPMCRTALESPEARELALAFNRGILFLLAVPFLAIAGISVMIWNERRRGARARGIDDGI